MFADPLTLEARETLRSLGIDPQSFVAESDGTVYTPLDDTGEAPDLPRLSAEELKTIRQLGRGGQGQVLLAEQSALGREVAVKRASGRAGTRAASTRALIHEGRVTGHLEHPNIVPVHALGLNEEGEVLLVMKRIEGDSWEKRLHDEPETLDAHIQILIKVAGAVAFAHERDILHRDLKPSNVMLGSHGEVYVLDWGLAIACGENAPPDIPRATVTGRVTGTPAYMPPEMATPGETFGKTSDVFLLGAVLYRIVTGRAPYQAKNVVDCVLLAQKGEVTPPEDSVDSELLGVLQRAMATDPEQRYPSAKDVASALETYRSNAFARRLTERAVERVEQLKQLSATASDDAEAARLFHEARFGFAQALEQSPLSTSAQSGRERAFILMMERELLRGRTDAAVLFAEELETIPADLQVRLNEAIAAQEELAAKASRADSLEADRDIKVGQRPRAWAAMVLGLIWAVNQFVLGRLVEQGTFQPDAGIFALAHVGFLTCIVAVVFVTRRTVLINEVGWHIARISVQSVLSLIVLWTVLWTLGIGVNEGLAIAHVLIFIAFASASIVDRRWLIAALIMLATVPLILWRPSWALEINGAAIGISFILLGVLSLAGPQDTDPPVPTGVRP